MSKDAAKTGKYRKTGSFYHSLGPRLCSQGKNGELPGRSLCWGAMGLGEGGRDVLSCCPPLVFFYKGKKMWKGCSMKRVIRNKWAPIYYLDFYWCRETPAESIQFLLTLFTAP